MAYGRLAFAVPVCDRLVMTLGLGTVPLGYDNRRPCETAALGDSP